MNDVTRILAAIEQGDPSAVEELLPLVYEELRKLAADRMSNEDPGQTLQATALVHEAYLKLVDTDKVQHWDSRGHFFAAAAEAMRRLLVDTARRKRAQKHGGGFNRVELTSGDVPVQGALEDVIVLSDAIDQLAIEDPPAAELAKLRIFSGLSVDEAGKFLGTPRTTAYRQWTYAQAWLKARLANTD